MLILNIIYINIYIILYIYIDIYYLIYTYIYNINIYYTHWIFFYDWDIHELFMGYRFARLEFIPMIFICWD